MSERNIKGTWNKHARRVSKTFSPMIGIVYKSQDYIGLLTSIQSDVATLRLKNNTLVQVQIKTLKAQTNE